MTPPLSEKAKENKRNYDLNYHKTNYKRVPLDISHDKYNEIKERSAALNESVNGFIKRAIDERLEQTK